MRALSIVRSAVQNPARYWALLQWVMQDPIGSYHYCSALRNSLGKPPRKYLDDSDWRARIGVASDDRAETERLWPSILHDLERQGIRPGPESYLYWNDGDPALVQAIWCLVRKLRATKVVETGVAHGLTSRFIL